MRCLDHKARRKVDPRPDLSISPSGPTTPPPITLMIRHPLLHVEQEQPHPWRRLSERDSRGRPRLHPRRSRAHQSGDLDISKRTRQEVPGASLVSFSSFERLSLTLNALQLTERAKKRPRSESLADLFLSSEHPHDCSNPSFSETVTHRDDDDNQSGISVMPSKPAAAALGAVTLFWNNGPASSMTRRSRTTSQRSRDADGRRRLELLGRPSASSTIR